MADVFQQKHGGNLTAASEEYGLFGAFLDYSANINPFGTPAEVLFAMEEAVKAGALEHYPDPACTKLTRTLSLSHGVSEENVLCGNGVSELINIALSTLPRGGVAIHAPGFSEYASTALITGHRPEYIPLERSAWEASRCERRYTGAILANPNNPTSRALKGDVLVSFLERCEWVLLDEAFIELCVPGSGESYLSLMKSWPNLIVLRAFTKSLAIPGLRLGYAVAEAGRIAKMRAVQIPWSVNALAQSVANALGSLSSYEAKTREWLTSEPERFYGKLDALPGVKAWKPDANFILCRLENGSKASEVAEELAKRGVLIRVAANFETLDETYFRVAVKLRQDNDRLLEELGAVLGGAQ